MHESLQQIGIDVAVMGRVSPPEFNLVADYTSQMESAALKAWGQYWPEQISSAVEESGLYGYIASVAAKAVNLLNITDKPELGLLDGFQFGMLKYKGYCWNGEDGKTWVGLDENWFNDVAEELREYGHRVPEYLAVEIARIMAEEVCHAYIREVRPDIAQASEEANASGDPDRYHNDPGERLAKEFAEWFVS